MKTNFNSDQKKAAGLHKVHLSGTGVSSSDCMSPAMYDELNDRGALKSVVYVCGQGWTAPDVPIDGYYTPNYEYEYDFEYSYDYEYEYNNTDNNNSGSQVGGSAPSGPEISAPTPVVPQAKIVFRNQSMTAENWARLEKMLENIMSTCLGKRLYNALVKILKGKTIAIKFVKGKANRFVLEDGIELLEDTASDGYYLIHEMMHLYQAYQHTIESWAKSLLNIEIEAHYAQYLYQSNKGGKYEDWYKNDDRMKSIKDLNQYLDEKGNLKPGVTESKLNTYLQSTVKKAFKNDSNYNVPYDEEKTGLRNFKNIITLTNDC